MLSLTQTVRRPRTVQMRLLGVEDGESTGALNRQSREREGTPRREAPAGAAKTEGAPIATADAPPAPAPTIKTTPATPATTPIPTAAAEAEAGTGTGAGVETAPAAEKETAAEACTGTATGAGETCTRKKGMGMETTEKGKNEGGERPRQITVNGFLVDVNCPTEERLTLRIDITNLPNHLAFLYGLQDLINAINANYSKKARPRACTVRYYKIRGDDGKESQRKILEFSPYPSPMINALKEARNELYLAIRRHCLVLASEKIGAQNRHLFFLPAGKASELEAEVQEINAFLKDLQGKIDSFESSGDAKSIMEYVAQVQPIKLAAVIGNAKINPVPFSLDRKFLESFVEDARRSLAEIDAKKEEGLRALEAELEERRKKMLSELEQSMKEKVLSVLDHLETTIKNNKDKPTTTLLNAVTSAASIASSLQLSIANPLKDLEKALQEKESASGAAKRLAISLGTPGASLQLMRERIKREPLLSLIE